MARRVMIGAGRGGLTMLVVAALWIAAPAAAAEPARAIDPASVQGCCVCRGTSGGEQTAVRSCSDGKSPGACVSACKSINADSIVFGYDQTCSQGCAGYPTQGQR